MAFVDDNKVEEVRWVLTEVRRWLTVFGRAAHEGLKDREEQTSVLRYLPLLLDVTRINAYHRVFGKSRKRIVGLVSEVIAVGKKENSRTARWFAAQVPSALEHFPSKLKRDKGLTGTGRQRKQNSLLTSGDGF